MNPHTYLIIAKEKKQLKIGRIDNTHFLCRHMREKVSSYELLYTFDYCKGK